MLDKLHVTEICSTSVESDTSDDDEGPSVKEKEEVENQKTVTFDDAEDSAERLKRKRRRTKRELRAEHAAKRERDRMAMVLPDPVRGRELERNLVRLATKGVVQLFNAVAERQKKLKGTLSANKKRRLRALSPESFNRKLTEPETVKKEANDTNDDWLSDDQVKTESETDGDLDTSEIKTEPESESE